MRLTKSTLITHGYKPIVSEAEAYHLVMREIKAAKSREARYGHAEWFRTDWARLQSVTVGKWYKFVAVSKIKPAGQRLLIAEPIDDDQFDEELECSGQPEHDLPEE